MKIRLLRAQWLITAFAKNVKDKYPDSLLASRSTKEAASVLSDCPDDIAAIVEEVGAESERINKVEKFCPIILELYFSLR